MRLKCLHVVHLQMRATALCCSEALSGWSQSVSHHQDQALLAVNAALMCFVVDLLTKRLFCSTTARVLAALDH
jgi:hypothetical protein